MYNHEEYIKRVVLTGGSGHYMVVQTADEDVVRVHVDGQSVQVSVWNG
jgi:hypothetical protein